MSCDLSQVQLSNLAVEVVERNVTPEDHHRFTPPSLPPLCYPPLYQYTPPSFPLPQEALLLLGAKYGPCMRRDRQLLEGVENSSRREANESGCCVRRDRSGCVQVPSSSETRCPVSHVPHHRHTSHYPSLQSSSISSSLPSLTSLSPSPPSPASVC